MQWREMIETASSRVGSQRSLAHALEMPEQTLTAAKKGARGLPDEACAAIAEILQVELGKVIAAKNFARAKNQGQRDFWLPFLDKAA